MAMTNPLLHLLFCNQTCCGGANLNAVTIKHFFSGGGAIPMATTHCLMGGGFQPDPNDDAMVGQMFNSQKFW